MKRHATKIVLFLLLGAILNVMVAWAYSLWGSWDENISDYHRTNFSASEWDQIVTRSGRGHTAVYETRARNGVARTYLSELHGWPVLSLKCLLNNGTDRPQSALVIDVGWLDSAFAPINYDVIPAVPIWPGFAINTIFYAAILWLLFAAPFAIRRHRRIKRGLCARCAYPVGTSAICSECGTAVHGSAVPCNPCSQT